MKNDIPTRSICRFIAILKVINTNGPISLLGIANAIDIPYPTVSRVVHTLLETGLIERVADTKRYRVTATVLQLSNGFADHDELVAAARVPMADFTERFGWPVVVETRVGASMLVRDSTHHLTSLVFSRCSSGYALPLLESASGHVHLAYAPEAERDCIIDGMEELGVRSPMLSLFKSDRAGLRIREDGYATCERSRHTLDPGKTSAISVPILDGDQLAGTMSVEFFASAMSMPEAVRRYLAELGLCASRIAVALREPAGQPSGRGMRAASPQAPRRVPQPRAANGLHAGTLRSAVA